MPELFIHCRRDAAQEVKKELLGLGFKYTNTYRPCVIEGIKVNLESKTFHAETWCGESANLERCGVFGRFYSERFCENEIRIYGDGEIIPKHEFRGWFGRFLKRETPHGRARAFFSHFA